MTGVQTCALPILDGPTRAANERALAPYKIEPPVPAHDIAPQPTTLVVEGAGAVEIPAASSKKGRAKKEKTIETSRLDVTVKYKKADLVKMSKKELQDLATKHSLEIKSRATKDELIKALSKV